MTEGEDVFVIINRRRGFLTRREPAGRTLGIGSQVPSLAAQAGVWSFRTRWYAQMTTHSANAPAI